jgi:GNAT superfamily N-acetyltransferase
MRTNILPTATRTIETVLAPLLRPPATPSQTLAPLPPDTPTPAFALVILRDMTTGRMIGDMQLFQPIPPGTSPEDQARLFAGTAKQTVPSSGQTWELAYNLRPEWQGKGVGGAVLDSVLEGWVKWVGIGTVMAVSQSRRCKQGLIGRVPKLRMPARAGLSNLGVSRYPRRSYKSGHRRRAEGNAKSTTGPCVWLTIYLDYRDG